MGQFDWLFSQGIFIIRDKLKAIGAEADAWRYIDAAPAAKVLQDKRAAGYKVASVGYSLGVSTATFLQTAAHFDAVLCIAASKLAANYPINHENTVRSVLWHGPGVLSGAGENIGFDEVIEVHIPPIPILAHLFMDFIPVAVDGIVQEVSHLRCLDGDCVQS